MPQRDWFSSAFGAAIDDIRKRVVEEPWLGRAVTPKHGDHSVSDALGWTREGQDSPVSSQGQAQDQGHDFDR
jgi:alkylated DNA repair dioxygenase AlkB